MDERRLVERCLAGESEGWREFSMYGAPFLARAVGRTFRRYGLREDAAALEEILQDVFLAVTRDDSAALRRFQWSCPLSHYLIAVAVNCTVDWLRKNRLPGAGDPQDGGARRKLEADLLADESDFSGERLRHKELVELVEKGLARLPERERQVLRLHYWGGLSTEASARQLGLNADSVRVFLSRARSRLGEILRRSPLAL